MKKQPFYGRDSILVIIFLTEFKGACDLSCMHEDAAILRFRELMNGVALTAMKAWSILSSNDSNRHEGAIMSYAGVVRHLLKRYATNTANAGADK